MSTISTKSSARRASLAVIACGCFAAAATMAPAAPMSLGFQGVINSVYDSFALSALPTPAPFTTIAAGESVTGVITFDPATNHTLSMQVHVNGWDLECNDVTTDVMNNRGVPTVSVFIDQAYGGPAAPDGVIFVQYHHFNSSSIAPFDDRIYLSNYYSGQQPSLLIPGFDDLQWQPALSLIGDQSLLAGEQLPADAAPWNAFDTKSLLLGFKTTSSRTPVWADVAISGFTAVPESASTSLALLAAAAMGSGRRRTGRAATTTNSR